MKRRFKEILNEAIGADQPIQSKANLVQDALAILDELNQTQNTLNDISSRLSNLVE